MNPNPNPILGLNTKPQNLNTMPNIPKPYI